MEKQELDALLAELSAQLRELGIPLGKHIAPQVEVNTRAQRRLGCCVCREGRFTIQVSARLLEDGPLLRATLLHELLHTCYGCQNHGKRWKAYAQRVGEALGWKSPAPSPWRARPSPCAKSRSSTCSSAKAAAGSSPGGACPRP